MRTFLSRYNDQPVTKCYQRGIEVSQGKDYVEIKHERYTRKILKEAGMEDCNETSYPMEKDLKLSKAKDEPQVEATQYKKLMDYLRYLLHTCPDLTYSVGVVQLHLVLNKNRSNDMKLAGYSDSSHNVDIDDGRNTTGHVFYLGTSPITWCSKKKTTVALSSCEAEFMAATAAACQAIWLRGLLAEVTGLERQKVIIRVDNKSTIALSKNPVFHGKSKHIYTRYHFIRECVENEQVIVKHVSRENQRADPLTKALARIRHMLDSEYGEQDKKAAILYEYEMFKATEGELLLDTYIRYLQVINDLKKCGYSKDNCELNFKFLNNLQPEWKQYAKKTVVVTSDPLALIAEKIKVSKRKEKVVVSLDSKGSEDDFIELKKITALLAKAFNRKKFYSKPTNNLRT
nr:uncharacterized mitochondrial protein AtMg00810-like [Tanacetum cinerariifolium]